MAPRSYRPIRQVTWKVQASAKSSAKSSAKIRKNQSFDSIPTDSEIAPNSVSSRLWLATDDGS